MNLRMMNKILFIKGKNIFAYKVRSRWKMKNHLHTEHSYKKKIIEVKSDDEKGKNTKKNILNKP